MSAKPPAGRAARAAGARRIARTERPGARLWGGRDDPSMPARSLLIATLLVSACGGPAAVPDAPPIGPAPGHRPASLSAAVAAGAPVGRLRCARRPAASGVAHVELFAHGLAMV